MSELSSNNEKRIEDLLAFSLGMMSGESGKMLIDKYSDAIAHVTPHDMLKLEDKQMQMGISPAEILKYARVCRVETVMIPYLEGLQ